MVALAPTPTRTLEPNRHTGRVATSRVATPSAFDVNADGFVNLLDVLLIINFLNSSVSSQGEGESTNGNKPIDDFFEHFASDQSKQDEHASALSELNAELAAEPLRTALRSRNRFSRSAK